MRMLIQLVTTERYLVFDRIHLNWMVGLVQGRHVVLDPDRQSEPRDRQDEQDAVSRSTHVPPTWNLSRTILSFSISLSISLSPTLSLVLS